MTRLHGKLSLSIENNVPRINDHPLLYFWQVVHRDTDRISIFNVGTALLAIQFVFDA